ncbi:YggN family protein [Shewanella sp. WXL01]|uniref:YggN family protein n=1 Tax=Shewanella sp. WXL01 TaxID=2709721 RepID=UPI00143837DE|nr:YggN family protein [Shewanella sp. WXL01]NKF50037.1 YggN family protein [Shewanella sp. WXL01]
MTNQHLLKAAAVTGLVLSTTFAMPAQAKISFSDDECNVALNYDITVEPKRLQVSDQGKEQYRIEMGELYVNGKQVELDAKQQALVNQYSDAVSKQVPEVIDLVGDVVVLATQAVSMALTPILGDAAGSQIDELMVGIQDRVDELAYQQGDRFFLGATETTMENAFNEEFEKEIEEVMTNSIGTMMMALGGQIMSSEGGSFEEKMEAFGRKMENIGDDIEMQIAEQSKDIEHRAEKVCENFQSVVELEQQLRREVPELAPYILTQPSSYVAKSE